MPDILIVQPSCPAYRRAFFEELAGLVNLRLICSETSLDGAATDLGESSLAVTIVPCAQLPGGVLWQRGISSCLMSLRPQVLVINGNPRYLSSLVAAVLARAMRIKLVWWGHAMSSTSRPLRAFLRKQFMRLANRIFLYYPEEIGKLPAGLRDRSVGLDNCVDTHLSLSIARDLGDDDLRTFRAAHALGDATLLVTIGRLTEKARIDLLLQAMSELGRRGMANVRLVIIGGGPVESSLKERAEKLGVDGTVIFTGTVYDERQIGLWLRSATLFVYGGAIGLSLIHAFCYALPVVMRSPLSSHGPEAVLFEPGSHGFLFESDNLNSLVDTLMRALGQRDKLTAMGVTAQELVRRRLSIEKMAANFVSGLNGTPPS